jgi:hypothetical protein
MLVARRTPNHLARVEVDVQPVRLAGCWWLVLVCSERKVPLTNCRWLVCSEKKVLLAGG